MTYEEEKQNRGGGILKSAKTEMNHQKEIYLQSKKMDDWRCNASELGYEIKSGYGLSLGRTKILRVTKTII
jgi:hypothetical protein